MVRGNRKDCPYNKNEAFLFDSVGITINKEGKVTYLISFNLPKQNKRKKSVNENES
jgi:hypothetical protein